MLALRLEGVGVQTGGAGGSVTLAEQVKPVALEFIVKAEAGGEAATLVVALIETGMVISTLLPPGELMLCVPNVAM